MFAHHDQFLPCDETLEPRIERFIALIDDGFSIWPLYVFSSIANYISLNPNSKKEI